VVGGVVAVAHPAAFAEPAGSAAIGSSPA
jgi:hypothetical protein